MNLNNIAFVLTDIEGTTTSVSFVYDKLFPYFREHISQLESMKDLPEVSESFEQTVAIARETEGIELTSVQEIIAQLLKWSLEDKKITPLKTLQGILWEAGYQSGEIKGHVYSDVAPALERWKNAGIQMGVFSSGSVAAQKLIFGYSEAGDLRPYFSAYFDTKTGGKRETSTYVEISKQLAIAPEHIVFLSDIKEELEAADAAGFQTVQLVRAGNEVAWSQSVADFSALNLNAL